MDKKLLFEIQTAQTGKIEISECDYLFEIIEIDCGDQNVIIWKKAFNSFEECVSFLETTTLDYPLKRNFKCWWLYCPIIYLSNDILNNLKKIIKNYDKNDNLKEAYFNRQLIYDDYYKSSFKIWLGLANLQSKFDINFSNNPTFTIFNKNCKFTLIFNGFDITKTNNYFSKITISNKELFQSLLNSIWNEISDEIPANTFNIRWKILDLEQEKYLYKKGDDFSLRQMGFSNFQTLIIIKII